MSSPKRTKTSKSPKHVTVPPRVAEEIGWVGALCIITGYALTSLHIISVDNIAYHILNLVGAAGIIIVAYSHHTRQTIVVSSIRGAIAMGSLGIIALQNFK